MLFNKEQFNKISTIMNYDNYIIVHLNHELINISLNYNDIKFIIEHMYKDLNLKGYKKSENKNYCIKLYKW